MSDITIEQAEQQLVEAKQREAEANKPWEIRPPTMGEMQTLRNLIDQVEIHHSELEDARQTLQDQWNDEVVTYNQAVNDFNLAQAELHGHISVVQPDWASNIEEYFAQEEEDNGKVVSDELRGHLINISEKLDEFSVNDVEEEESDKYIEEADISDSFDVANDLNAQLGLLQEFLDKEEDPFLLITHRKKDVENWGNNQSIWQVYDDLKDEDVDVRALLVRYALSYYNPEGTGYFEMLNELAIEFHIDVEGGTDES